MHYYKLYSQQANMYEKRKVSMECEKYVRNINYCISFYGYLFLFSSVNKLKTWKIIITQLFYIRLYLNSLYAFYMARDSIRIFIGIGFLLGFATFYVIPGAILLLIIYTIAIIINLVKVELILIVDVVV